MAEDSFGDLNTIGQTRIVGRMGSMGGNDGRGPVDNVLPTGIVARGTDVKGAEGFMRGVRRDMSTGRNSSKARMGDR